MIVRGSVWYDSANGLRGKDYGNLDAVQVGDSGAPVISQSNTNMAVGLQSGFDGPNIAYYSHIGWVLYMINASLRITD